MPDINLLPQDLRKKEEEEIKHKKGGKKIELKVPEEIKKRKETRSFSFRFSNWFKKIFEKIFLKITPQSDKILERRKEVKKVSLKTPTKVKILEEHPVPKIESLKKEERPKMAKSPQKQQEAVKISQKKEVPKVTSEIEINLLPFQKLEVTPEKKFKFLGLGLIVAILLVGGIYGGLKWYTSSRSKEVAQLEEELKRTGKEVGERREILQEVFILEERFKQVFNLLNNHSFWSSFLKFLEKNTIPSVYYTSLSVSEKDVVSLQARAKDFRAVAEELVVFQEAQDFLEGVTISSLSVEQKEGEEGLKEISFDLQLILKPEMLTLEFQ